MSSLTHRTIHFASATSERLDTRAAVREATAALAVDRPEPPDLVLVYASPHHAGSFAAIAGLIRETLGDTRIAGCSAVGVIGAGRELEHREALSITAAWLPHTRVRVVHVPVVPNTDAPEAFTTLVGATDSAVPHFLIFADPQTEGVERLLRGLDGAYPNSIKAGGLASGPQSDRGVTLFVDDRLEASGALLVVLDGGVELHTVVAQGCRPVGDASIVTRSRGNVIQETNAGKPSDVLRKLYDNLSARDQTLFNSSLFLGVEMRNQTKSYTTGDFLVRNILGVDRETGAMAIDTRVQDYQVVQFQLRDKDTSSQDLAQRLRVLSMSDAAPRIAGALLFSCSGRGERLYGAPHHDSDAFARRVSSVSLSGFFCNGEVGPVGGQTFVHGYTSVFVIFCAPAQPT
jgi:small ligand-binding sensory domain FIST